MSKSVGVFKASTFGNSRHVEDFKELADKLVKFGLQTGVRIIGYRDSRLPLFGSLPPTTQSEIIRELKLYLEICDHVVADGYDLGDSKKLLWYALSKLGYVPPSNMFEKIDNTWVLEVHDRELHQVFRNFVYYQYCSYSLEEIYCTPWPDLYNRDESSLESMMVNLRKLYDGEATFVDCSGVQHSISEKYSAFKYSMNYELVCAFALKNKASHKVEAAMMCERAKILNPPSRDQEETMLKAYLQVPDGPFPLA